MHRYRDSIHPHLHPHSHPHAGVLLLLSIALACCLGVWFFSRPPQAPDSPLPAAYPVISAYVAIASDLDQDLDQDSDSDLDSDWQLILVNATHPLPAEYCVTLATLENSLQVDERCLPDLQAMLDACREAGFRPVVCSAYRSIERQEQLFADKQDRLRAAGVAEEQVYAQAAEEVAVPGTSEHHTGLALDIVDEDYQLLDSEQEHTPVQQWLLSHAWEYGFILRYPNGSSDVTGIIYEPWHYRYVGRTHARAIETSGLTLEEYVEELN